MDRLPSDSSMLDLRPFFEDLILDASSGIIFGEAFEALLTPEKRDPTKSIDSRKLIESFNCSMKSIEKRIVFSKLSFFLYDPL